MTLRELALTLPCRRKKCGAKPGEFCTTKPRFTTKGQKYYRIHLVRRNDARKLQEAQAKIEDWNRRYAPQNSLPGEGAKP